MLQYSADVDSLNLGDPIEIICNNWRNPAMREVVTGFSVLTFDINRSPIDYSGDLFQIDATQFEEMKVDGSLIGLHLSHHHANELSEYKIYFDAGLPIDSNGGCFVKYTFPPELLTS